VLWVGLPAVSGANATGEMSYLDGLYRARAEKAGITYVNIWDGFVDDQGRYAVQGPDFEGQIRRLCSGDGVHFSNAGALKLAHTMQRTTCAVCYRNAWCRSVMSRGAAIAAPVGTPGRAPRLRNPRRRMWKSCR